MKLAGSREQVTEIWHDADIRRLAIAGVCNLLSAKFLSSDICSLQICAKEIL